MVLDNNIILILSSCLVPANRASKDDDLSNFRNKTCNIMFRLNFLTSHCIIFDRFIILFEDRCSYYPYDYPELFMKLGEKKSAETQWSAVVNRFSLNVVEFSYI